MFIWTKLSDYEIATAATKTRYYNKNAKAWMKTIKFNNKWADTETHQCCNFIFTNFGDFFFYKFLSLFSVSLECVVPLAVFSCYLEVLCSFVFVQLLILLWLVVFFSFFCISLFKGGTISSTFTNWVFFVCVAVLVLDFSVALIMFCFKRNKNYNYRDLGK